MVVIPGYEEEEESIQKDERGQVGWLSGPKCLSHKSADLSSIPRTISGRRGMTPKSCPLISTCAQWHIGAPALTDKPHTPRERQRHTYIQTYRHTYRQTDTQMMKFDKNTF